MSDCPFCKTEIHPEATVCPACNAGLGFGYAGQMHGKITTIFVFLFCKILVVGSAAWVLFLKEYFMASDLSYAIVSLCLLIGLPPFISLGRQLLSGPAWFKSTTPR